MKTFIVLLCGLMILVPSTNPTSSAEEPMPPPQTDWIDLDEVQSWIKDTGLDWTIYVWVHYDTLQANRAIRCSVFDENQSAWRSANVSLPEPPNPTSTFVVAQPANDFVVFEYRVLKTSPWGQAISDGSFDQAYCWAGLYDDAMLTNLLDDDEDWVYVPTPPPGGGEEEIP